ncbi:hypothetical protein AB0I28_23550 [Phytomonospora sp. NPDC050363]|uniref:hypothetical protein n=1 Tax=Phytomonospora sp. NPDC050363 TaxID=3155642 RepID=UPI00340A3801
MSWFEVRAGIDAAVEEFEALAARITDHARDADEVGSRIATVYAGSNHRLPESARDHTASAADRASEAAEGYLAAAGLCRDYLAVVDPDGAAGSVAGLGPPAVVGPLKGGHGPAGSPAARAAVSDVSRCGATPFPSRGRKGWRT